MQMWVPLTPTAHGAGSAGSGVVTRSLKIYYYCMTLSDRDRTIISYVTRFKQLSSSHIHELVFSSLTTNTPTQRALRRLVESGHLARIEHRLVGGSRGGSGIYVYQLGRKATDFYQGRYLPSRAVNYHSLAIADCYLEIRRLDRAGQVQIVALSTEPDCHTDKLKPDMFIALNRPEKSRLDIWFEIDMGTESQVRIREKLQRYWREYEAHTEGKFPAVVFVAVDEDRRRELAWMLTQVPRDVQEARLFRVVAKGHLANLFNGG